jgi:hypothetical protein
MRDIAAEMDYYGGMAEWSLHAGELTGAASIVEEWVQEVRGEGSAA